jgi:hypothetical protein
MAESGGWSASVNPATAEVTGAAAAVASVESAACCCFFFSQGCHTSTQSTQTQRWINLQRPTHNLGCLHCQGMTQHVVRPTHAYLQARGHGGSTDDRIGTSRVVNVGANVVRLLTRLYQLRPRHIDAFHAEIRNERVSAGHVDVSYCPAPRTIARAPE